MEPNEMVADKCHFGEEPSMASELHASAIQVAPNAAKKLTEEKKVSSENMENEVFLKNTEYRVSSESTEYGVSSESTEYGVSSESTENTDASTDLESELSSASVVEESTGEVGQDTARAKQDTSNEHGLQNTDDESESTDDDSETDGTDESDEHIHPNRYARRAPLLLIIYFLAAEMNQNYYLARTLCKIILIYEPQNPEAREFLPLLERMLEIQKIQNLEEDEDSRTEDSSDEC